MSYPLQRETIAPGVSFSSIIDPKFKHNRISINMILPLEEGKIEDRAVVPYILRQGTQQYPSFTHLNERLSELYGASLEAFVDKFGAYQLLCLSIVGIDSRFAFEGEEMVKETAGLLAEVLLCPHLEQGVFSSKNTQLEKEYLKDTIESEINDKRTYAVMQCKTLMCAGEAIALRKYGTVEGVEKITPTSAYAAYQELLKTAQIEIMMEGSGKAEIARAVFAKRFADMERTPIAIDPVRSRKKPSAEQKNQEQQMDVSQGKLVMGFQMPTAETAQQKCAARVAVALLGGTATSLLFLNVREKLSLCYYCQSRLDPVTGIMLVDSGVEAENAQKAKEEILHQIDRLKAGDFGENEIEETKLILKTAFRSTTDSLSALENWYLTQILNNTMVSPEEQLSLTQTVTKEQIVAEAQKIQLDTVYTLLPKQN